MHWPFFNKKLEENKLEEEKKPGTTRLAFIALAGAIAIIAVPIVAFTFGVNVEGLKELAMLCAGAVIGSLGSIVNHYFSK